MREIRTAPQYLISLGDCSAIPDTINCTDVLLFVKWSKPFPNHVH